MSGSWSAIDAACAPNSDDGRVDHRAQDSASPPRRLEAGRGGCAGGNGLERPASCVVGSVRRASCVSRRASGTTSVSRSNRTSPRATKSASSRFTDSREPPTMPASSAWVQGQSSRTSPSWIAPPVAGPLGRAREVGDPEREAARQVEEVERLDVVGEAPQLAGERRGRASAGSSARPRTAARSRRGRGPASRSARARRPTPSAAPRRASPAPRRTRPGRGWRGSPARRCRATAGPPSPARSRRRTARHPGRPGGTRSRHGGSAGAGGTRGRRRGRPRRRARTARIARAPPGRGPRRSTACRVAHRTRIRTRTRTTLRPSLRSRTRRAQATGGSGRGCDEGRRAAPRRGRFRDPGAGRPQDLVHGGVQEARLRPDVGRAAGLDGRLLAHRPGRRHLRLPADELGVPRGRDAHGDRDPVAHRRPRRGRVRGPLRPALRDAREQPRAGDRRRDHPVPHRRRRGAAVRRDPHQRRREAVLRPRVRGAHPGDRERR